MKKGKTVVGTLLLMLMMVAFNTHVKAQNAEHQVKTVFIYNFIRYIEWPKQGEEFTIGIYGNDPEAFSAFMDMAAKKAATKRIVVKSFTSLSEAASCDILFIPAQNSGNLNEVKSLGLKNILVVTEKAGLAKKGSGINFINVDGKLRFEINRDEIERSGLKVSSQLLGLAIEV
ncbi:hypothetical protein C900_00605 [Fulvivirga imtechensis AK7]|uniref:Transmembrane protein n=1 Tax=Fulvivirga imtechensis AK7 TaxID=1237149 RepID=L8JHE6_9BACT|nr:YfiR family protein [Fulvivirga imtechensis]ELR68251.1 hypothetical protein C900_00605 [Fulvivirga imtechensis AK7]